MFCCIYLHRLIYYSNLKIKLTEKDNTNLNSLLEGVNTARKDESTLFFKLR